MYKCLLIIAVLCFCIYAQNAEDSLSANKDSTDSFVPDPERIARNYIKTIRSFSYLDTLEQDQETTFPLTLDDAVLKLIDCNKDVKKAKLEFLIGEKRYLASFGTFEPYLTGSHKYSESDRPDAILVEMRESLTGSIEGVLPTATRYNLSLAQNDVRFVRNSLDWPSVSSYISITQPVLRDLIGNSPLSDIKIAKAERQVVYNRYRSTLILKCYELESTYWKLVYLQEKRRNAEKSVKIANQIVNESRTLVASGIISKLDATEVSSQLALRQTTLSKVKMDHAGVINELILLIGFPPDSALMKLTAVTPLLVDPKKQVPDFVSIGQIDSLLNVLQPDLLAAEFTRIRSRTAVSQLRGKALPELNVTGTLGISGEKKNFNAALDQFLNAEMNNHNWACAIEMKVPIGSGIRERNLLKAEKLNYKIAELEKKSIRDELASQSILTVDKIRDLTQNLKNASIVVEYRTTLLQSEIVRLRAGLSNVRKIFEMEEELANARESELEIKVQYHLTLSLYDRIMGTTLSKRGLESMVDGKPVLKEVLTREE